MRECKLRTTLRSKWNKAGEQRQGNQYNNLQNWIGGNVEVKAEAPIIAMRLSLARVKEHGYRVTYDSSEEGNAFHVHKSDGTVRVFEESDKGLYYMDTKLNKTIITLM